MRRGHWRWSLLLLGLVLALPVTAAASPPDARVLRAQILLARAGFSPGVVDGRDGDNFANALHAFEQANGLRPGPLDNAGWTRLEAYGGAPAVGHYTIQPADTAGPFAPKIPQDFTRMAQLPQLAYQSPRQLLAAKFHMSEALLSELNPNVNFAQAGAEIAVADVRPPAPTAAEGSGSSTPAAARAEPAAVAKIVVDKRQRAVLAYDARNAVVGFYPASIGSQEKPAPTGAFRVTSIVFQPDYTYNPRYHFKGQTAQQPVRVAPGPNNPVGLVWIGLSLKGYGIHGAPDPDTVGKTQSHGCVRLTNWDATALARQVRRGTPVVFVG